MGFAIRQLDMNRQTYAIMSERRAYAKNALIRRL